jgi:hypothetical protein
LGLVRLPGSLTSSGHPIRKRTCPNPKCNQPIGLDHSYTWCSKCGEELPETIQAQRPRLREQSARVSIARANLVESASQLTLAEDAEAIARLYRRLVLLIGVQILMSAVLQFTADPEQTLGLALLLLLVGVAIVITIALVVTTYKLAGRLKAGPPLLWAIALFISCVNTSDSWPSVQALSPGVAGTASKSACLAPSRRASRSCGG